MALPPKTTSQAVRAGIASKPSTDSEVLKKALMMIQASTAAGQMMPAHGATGSAPAPAGAGPMAASPSQQAVSAPEGAPSPSQASVAPAAPVAMAPAPVPTTAGPEADARAAMTGGEPQVASAAPPQPKGIVMPPLPMGENGPDPNDPKYQGEDGQALFNIDSQQHEHDKKTQEYLTQLDALWNKAHPGRDWEGEFKDAMAMQKQHEQDRPKGNAVMEGLLKMGSFNPADAGDALANEKAGTADAQKRSDNSFSQQMMLKQKMHEGKAAEAETKGDWAVALRERKAAAEAESANSALSFEKSRYTQKKQIEGANQRATIRAQAVVDTAHARARAMATSHGITGGLLAAFQKELGKNLADVVGGQNLNKSYDLSMMDTVQEMIDSLVAKYEPQGPPRPAAATADEPAAPAKQPTNTPAGWTLKPRP